MNIYLIFKVLIRTHEPKEPLGRYICTFISYDDAIQKARRLASEFAERYPSVKKKYDATLTSQTPFSSVVILSNGDAVRFEVHKDFAL